MKAYKLVRKLKNGNLTSLFINKGEPIEFDKWIKSETSSRKLEKVGEGWRKFEKVGQGRECRES